MESNFKEFIQSDLVQKSITILAVFLVGFITSKILRWIFTQRVEKQLRENYYNKRLLTIVRLFNNLIRVVIIIICVIIALDTVGINTASILTTLGVGSLALSFGAQTLVKDCISGFFIILENQFSVGDTVIIENRNGVIEDIGLRTTTIRDFDGSKHIIPNGQIGIVTNQQRGNMRAKVVFVVDIKEEPKRVLEILSENLKTVEIEGNTVEVSIWGVTDNLKDGYEITVSADIKAGLQFKLEYSIRQKVVELFKEYEIKTPLFRYTSE